VRLSLALRAGRTTLQSRKLLQELLLQEVTVSMRSIITVAAVDEEDTKVRAEEGSGAVAVVDLAVTSVVDEVVAVVTSVAVEVVSAVLLAASHLRRLMESPSPAIGQRTATTTIFKAASCHQHMSKTPLTTKKQKSASQPPLFSA
jgi:hypothetical protein